MARLHRFLGVALIVGILFLLLVPGTVLADGLVNVGVNVGGPSGINGNVNVGIGGSNGTNVNANVGVGTGGSVVNGNVNANVGGGSVATGNVNANVGGGSVASGNVNANVGGGGSAAYGNAAGNAGNGSIAASDTSVNVGNSGGPGNNGGGGIAGVDTTTTVVNTPNGSVAAVTGCVQVGANCDLTPPPSTIGANACAVVGGNCGTTPAVTTGTTPLIGANACVVAGGDCTTQPPSTPPLIGANGCVALGGTCNGSTTPTGPGIGIGVIGTTPIGGIGGCIVALDSCGTVGTPGGPGAPGAPGTGTVGGPGTGGPGNGTTTGGTTTGPTGGPLTIQVTGSANPFVNTGVVANTQNQANPALCALPLTAFSKDATMTGTIVDCTTVHVAGNRSVLPAGYGQSEDSATAGAATAALDGSGRVLTDITGSCTGCETAFGSGSGYRAFVQLKDQATGDFINVGIVHDATAAATGENNPGGLTLAIETGRNGANGYTVSQGFLATDASRVLSGHATILLSWNAQGVTVAVDGVVLPNESAARPATVGTYAVRMTQPVIGFDANAKNPGERVDTTFKSISFG